MLWSQLKAGEAFRVDEKDKPIGRPLVKLQYDPFNAPIGDLGCVNPYTGEVHNATEFLDMDKPLENQIRFVDLTEH